MRDLIKGLYQVFLANITLYAAENFESNEEENKEDRLLAPRNGFLEKIALQEGTPRYGHVPNLENPKTFWNAHKKKICIPLKCGI